jgi:DNA-binding CsgD family transcriptional regulator
MADGASREEIARSRGRAVGTVRNQLKSIFSKLGVSREAELVAMMHGGLAR